MSLRIKQPLAVISMLILAVVFWRKAESVGPARPGTLDVASVVCSGAPDDCGGGMISVSNSYESSQYRCMTALTKERYSIGQPYGVPSKPIAPIAALERVSLLYAGGSNRIVLPSSVNLPSWSFSAIWDLDESAVIASDTSRKSIYHFSLKNGLISQIITSSLNSEKPFLPNRMQRIADGYIVENSQGDLVWLDRNFSIMNETFLLDVEDSSSFISKSVTAWINVGSDIIAFGDRVRDKKEWSGAIMKFSGLNPQRFETLHVFDLNSRTRKYARLGFPIFASAQGKAFVLLMEGSPSIYEIGSGLRRLNVFPDHYDTFPEFESKATEVTTPQIYSTFERSQMPVALYGQGDFLYLLLRRPEASGTGTLWTLAKIDPSKQAIISTLKLPTNSPQILLVPGNRAWAIIEKDSVKGIGVQRVESIITIRDDFFGRARSRGTSHDDNAKMPTVRSR